MQLSTVDPWTEIICHERRLFSFFGHRLQWNEHFPLLSNRRRDYASLSTIVGQGLPAHHFFIKTIQIRIFSYKLIPNLSLPSTCFYPLFVLFHYYLSIQLS